MTLTQGHWNFRYLICRIPVPISGL